MQSNRKLKYLKFLTETDRWVYIKAAKKLQLDISQIAKTCGRH